MNAKRAALQGYFAGIFDGEGSVGIYKFNSNGKYFHYNIKVTVNMQDIHAVGLLWREYPEGRLYCTKARDAYIFELYGSNCYKFLKEIKPFTLIKYEQVKIGLSFLAHMRRNQRKRKGFGKEGNFIANSEAYNRRCDKLVQMCKNKKHRIDKGVNSVNTLLNNEMREYRAKRSEVELDVKLIREHFESVETRLSENNKITSAPEKDIVHE